MSYNTRYPHKYIHEEASQDSSNIIPAPGTHIPPEEGMSNITCALRMRERTYTGMSLDPDPLFRFAASL